MSKRTLAASGIAAALLALAVALAPTASAGMPYNGGVSIGSSTDGHPFNG